MTGHGRVGQAVEPGDGLVESVIRDGSPGRANGDRRRLGRPRLPIDLEGVPSAVLAATRSRADRPFSELELRHGGPAGHADRGRAAQRRAACRVSEAAVARSADGAAQPPVLRRGGRDRLRRGDPERSRAEPDRLRPRPLLRGQQRPRPRGRRRRAATRRSRDGLSDPERRHRGALRRGGVRGDRARRQPRRGGRGRRAGPRRRRGRDQPVDRRARDPDHDLGRRRVTPRRRNRRPGPLPGRRLRAARGEARRPRPRGERRYVPRSGPAPGGSPLSRRRCGSARAGTARRSSIESAGLAGRAAALPATERLDARPRAGRRAGAAVHVQHARLDLGRGTSATSAGSSL